ncbi:MAG: T9SS type A sorting domain-containing protein [Flavobacteriales bacterium]|nr:T9SS type A sorting domain-containing protein [Flavobacteriales bacterium]
MTAKFSRATQNAQLTVADPLGHILLSERITGREFTLDLTSAPRGVYFVSLRDVTGVAIERFILQ